MATASREPRPPRGPFPGRLPPSALCVLALWVLPFSLHTASLWRGEIPWFMDTLTQFYPMRVHAAHLLRSGHLPLWNRTLFAGVPLLANPQWGLLYPGHWPLFLFPGPRAFTAINVCHIAWMGTGMFAWVFAASCKRRAGALAAGLFVEVGGWTWAHLAFGSYLQVAAWMPWILWTFESLRRRGEGGGLEREGSSPDSRRAGTISGGQAGRMLGGRPVGREECRLACLWGLAGGVFGAMQWLAGAPQLALYCHGALALFALLSYLGDRKALTARASLAFLAAQGLTSLGLSAPQWAPTYAFLADCERAGGVDLARVMVGTVSAGGLWSAWFGGTGVPEDAEQIIYPGVPVVLLALWAMADGGGGVKRKVGAPVEGAVSGGAEGSCGAGNGRQGRCARQGPWRPDKASLLAAVGWIVAASMGCWSVLGPLWYRVAPFYSRFHDPRRMLFLAYVGTIFLAGLGFQLIWGGGRPGRRVRATRRRRIVVRALLAAGACGGCMWSVWFGKARIDSKTIRAAEFHLANAERETGISRGERFFAQDIGMQYSGNYTRGGFGRSLMPNLGALYGFEDVQGYDPCIPWRYALYMRRLNSLPAPTVTLFPTHFGLVRSPDSPWLSRFGPMKVRGPVDCQWPFFLPRWAAPGEEFVIPLARPYEVDAGRLGDVRAYLSQSLDAAGRPMGGELELVFLDGEDAAGSLTLSAPESAGESEDENAEFLWPEVLPPRGRGHRPARRAAVGNVRLRGPSPQLADRLLVRNRSRRTGVLLYSLGLPRPALRFQQTVCAGTFESSWEEGFPDRVQVHFVSAEGAEERRLYERWAMRLPSGSVHVEIPPGQEPPDAPPRVIRGWRWRRRSANHLEIELSGERPAGGGWLVLGEPFARGWRCRVDGRPTEIRVADTLFRAVAVREGDRTVEMRYRPPGLALGLATAGLTFLAMLALVFPQRKAGRQRLEAAVEGSMGLCYR